MSGDGQAALEYEDVVRGVLASLRGNDTESALAGIDHLVQIDDRRPESYFLLGLTALEMNEKGRALEYFEKAAAIDPDCFEYAEALANLYTQVGRLSEGLFYAKLSTTLIPHPTIDGLLPMEFSNYFTSMQAVTPSTNYLKGIGQYRARKFSDCIRNFDRELRINPDHANCRRDLGDALAELGKYADALHHLSRAAELKPDDADTRFKLGNLCYRLGEFEEAILQHKEALKYEPDSIEFAAAVLARSTSLPPGHTDAVAAFRSALNERLKNSPELPPEAIAGDGEETTGDDHAGNGEAKVRIAYLTNRFSFGEQIRMIDPLLPLHDRAKFEVTVYQQSYGGDLTTQRLRSGADNVRYVGNLDDEHLAVIITGDEIDVLVDLCSDDPNNRATVMNMHPAKIQVGGWGAGMGLGMPGIDVVLTDEIIEDAVKAELGPDQKAHRLDYGLLSYNPSQILPALGDLPALKRGGPSIGVSCDAGAIMRDQAEMLSGILTAVPNSKIIVGAAPIVDREAFGRIKSRFGEFGVADRVEMSVDQKYADQLIVDPNFWQNIDVFIDVGRHASPSIVADALWMGIPVLSLKGERPFDRMGSSVVYTAARPDWIADTPAELIDLAVAVLGDIPALAETRKGLRNEMRRALLFNPEPHVRAVERAYLRLLGRDAPTP